MAIIVIDDADTRMLEKVARARTEAAAGLADRGGVSDHPEILKRRLGASGELAVSRLLGIPFDESPFGLDVGAYNVRTRGKHEYDLIIQDHDVEHHPDVPYVLVTADPTWRAFFVRGWYTPEEAAKRPDWRKRYGGYREAYFVPQVELHDRRRLRRETP